MDMFLKLKFQILFKLTKIICIAILYYSIASKVKTDVRIYAYSHKEVRNVFVL